MLKFARWWKPDEIVVLGDFADFYSVSSHSKSPDRTRKLEEEAAAVNRRLSQLDELGAASKFYVAGNHEDRLDRYLADKAPELHGLVNFEQLFKLTERGWHVTPYKRSLKRGKLTITHDAGNAGAVAHTKALDAFQGNVVIGHTHRMAVSYVGNARGKTHVGAMFGWLGDVEAVDYLHQIQAQRAWHLGFGIGYQEPNGVIHLQPVPMIEYRCVVEGKLFKG